MLMADQKDQSRYPRTHPGCCRTVLFMDERLRSDVNAVPSPARAEVNLAAVNYHFGSKEALLREVFRRRLSWLNASVCRLST
jgi:hypothetical protein